MQNQVNTIRKLLTRQCALFTELSDEHIDKSLATCVTAKSEVMPQSIATNEDQCSICCECILPNQCINRLTCGHTFHVHCMLVLLANGNERCPICRSTIDVPPIRDSYQSMPSERLAGHVLAMLSTLDQLEEGINNRTSNGTISKIVSNTLTNTYVW